MSDLGVRSEGAISRSEQRRLDADRGGGRRRVSFSHELSRFIIPILLVVMIAVFSVLRPESFFTLDNLITTLNTQAVIIIVALASMIPFIGQQFDLSIPTTTGLANVLVVGIVVNQGGPVWLAILGALAAAVIIGAVNGLLVVRFSLASIVVTLGMASAVEGMQLYYSHSLQILNAPESLTRIGRAELAGIPLPVIYSLVLVAICYVALERLVVGRRLYAVGGSARAAELSGIRVKRYAVGVFVVGAFLAAIAGIVQGARLGSATPVSTGGLLLPVFASVFLGTTTITPGRYNVLGTVVSVFFLAVAFSGLQYLGAPIWVQPFFNGMALMIAVTLGAIASRRQAAAAKKEQLQLLAEEATPAGPREA